MNATKNMDSGHRLRVQKKFLMSPEFLEDYEFLELLLFWAIPRKDTKNIAKQILSKYSSFEDILLHADDLNNIKGIGKSTSNFFKVIKELCRRLKFTTIKNNENSEYISGLTDVVEYLRINVCNFKKEVFGIMLFSGENRILNNKILFTGTIDKVSVHKREVIEYVLKNNANRVIIYHNHPNYYDCMPSKEDISLTNIINEALLLIDVELLDHVIISDSSYYSFKRENRI